MLSLGVVALVVLGLMGDIRSIIYFESLDACEDAAAKFRQPPRREGSVRYVCVEGIVPRK